MPPRTYLPRSTLQLADEIDGQEQLENALASVRAPSMLDNALASVRKVASQWQPLPIVVSGRPENETLPIPSVPKDVPQTAQAPSGTPSAMPTAPQQPDVTFQDGRQQSQPSLRPGESVGDVTISSGTGRGFYRGPAGGADASDPGIYRGNGGDGGDPGIYRGGDLRAYARAAALRNGVDPDIFERQIDQESGFQNFRPDGSILTSAAGAAGIGQFMPGTASSYGVDVNDPYSGLDGAARHMADNLKRNGGNYRMALAAYNAGQGNVDKYGEGVFGADFANGQTRDYVNIILGGRTPNAGAPSPAVSPPAPVAAASSPAPSAAGAPLPEPKPLNDLLIRNRRTGQTLRALQSEWGKYYSPDEWSIIEGAPEMQKVGADLPESGESPGDQKRARLAAARGETWPNSHESNQASTPPNPSPLGTPSAADVTTASGPVQNSGQPLSASGNLMLRQPLQPTMGPDTTTGEIPNPDDGPRELGYTVPPDPAQYAGGGDDPGYTGSDAGSSAVEQAPVRRTTGPADFTYANGGEPTASAQYTEVPLQRTPPPEVAFSNGGDPLTDQGFQEVPIAPMPRGRDTGVTYGPDAPSSTVAAGRIQYPNQTPLVPAYGPEQPPEPPSRWSPGAQAALAGTAANPESTAAALPGTPTLPGVSGRMLTETVNQAGGSQNQAISPLAVYQAISEIPFDVYTRARSELIADAEQGRMTGTDPLAPFRAMGVQFPEWLSPEAINPEGRPAGDIMPALLMSGVLPDPADPLVAQGFRLAGATARAGGRVIGAAAPVIGEGIERGGHAALDALEAGGRRVGRAIDANAERVAAADARMATEGSTSLNMAAGPSPGPETRIPRAGYAQDISPGAEQMVRDATEANVPRETVRRAEVARKAEDVLGVSPEQAQRWQQEVIAEAPDARAVRGEALRQAAYIDAENADRSIERLRAAQKKAQEAAEQGVRLSDDDSAEIADAMLEAAETARAFGVSEAASTAEGRATARALSQRRQAVTARQAFATAARARQVAQDAAFAARDVSAAAARGQVTNEGVQRLRILRDKLLEAERHGLEGDGAGGRLAAMEQPSVTAAATVGGPVPAPAQRLRLRSQGSGRVQSSARPQIGLGTQIATDVGNSVLGAGAGGITGYLAPAESEEERRKGARLGALVGSIGYPIVGRTLRGRSGALATFGPSPTPENPRRAIAVGADPSKRYEFRYRVADLRDLVPSNLPSGAANPAFPKELQPRARERVASQLQIDQIARGLEPDALLNDVGRLDAGPMIVGSDNIVESGNGRTLALQKAASEYPERYQAYSDALRRDLGQYGLSDVDLNGIELPVLVRERVSDVDRAAFAQEANNAGLLRMSSFEQSVQDAGNLSDDVVTRLQVGENDTIASALRKTENRDLVRQWVGTLPENERGGVLDAGGQLSAQGYERLTNALLVRTYGQGAGERLARTFIESADPTVRNVQTALMASLPDVARSEALIRSGQRDAGLSIAEDVAAATEMLARLRRDGVPVREYLSQSAMFDRELTPFQEEMLSFLDRNQRRQVTIREALREYAGRVENAADPNQGDMFGGMVEATTREDAWRSATATIEREQTAAAEARAAARRARPNGAGLATAGPESLADAIDVIPSTGGPEGRLSVEGAPEPTRRPGPIPENVAPRGGPEGVLAQEGAPVPLARPPSAERGILPTGGPEGTLTAEGAPVRLAAPTSAERGTLPSGGPEASLTRGTAAPLADLTREARTWMQRALDDTNNQALDAEFRSTVQALADHSPQGRKVALDLLARHETAMSEQATKLLGDVEKRLADNARRASEQQARGIEQSRIRGVVAQIDEVLANPQAPGSTERLQQLHADLTEISAQGFKRASDIRRRLHRTGLLKAGIASKDSDFEALVTALSRVDPDRPEEMQAVLNVISKPRLIDRLLEYQYVNMLSSPMTQAVNVSSNALQIAGRLLLQNPLEFAYSGGTSTGVGAAFQGAARGFREGLPEAREIMRTGTSSNAVDRAIEMGSYGQVNREALTEKFGKAGALLHVISTRPLAAMDALLGHTAYASAAEQFAQRKADQLLRSKSASVAGMDRNQARQAILANIWDHPDIIERAGKIEDYTLLKSKDTKGQGWGRIERNLRMLASLRTPAEDAGGTGQVIAFLANQVVPFFNVPLNFAKQGAERTVGAPINAVRAGRAYARGDVERGAELASKATIGAAAMGTAAYLAAGDNLTGDGPSDAGKRAIWELTHKRNAWRVPGTDTWYSWEGTPWAIPFGMMAGAKEGVGEALERSQKKGQSDPGDVIGAAAIKGGQGAAQGFFSQSFIRGLADQYKLITGQESGLGAMAAQGASTVSRAVPGAGMLGFFARVADDVERDAGRPQSFSELPENIGARIATRLPGARQQVDSRLNAYGQPDRNEQGGAAGILPYYRGPADMAGDPITRRVEAAGTGAIAPPPELTISYKGRSYGTIPLTMREQRRFQAIAGQEFRRELEQSGAATASWTPDVYAKIRASARAVAEAQVTNEIGGDEINRRLAARPAPQPVGAP